MVSDTYEPTEKEKQQVQQSYKAKNTVKRLAKTTKDFTSLETLQKTPENHGKWQSSSSSDGLD